MYDGIDEIDDDENPAADDHRLRPEFHFASTNTWINDPNGLVFLDGEYHLFFQTNPDGSDWGNISWGHAVSHDLHRWHILDVALRPYQGRDSNLTMIFSGSAAVGRHGDFDGALVAHYTGHERDGDTAIRENVCLAVSHDGGRNWVRDRRNPILDLHLQDFRDPKVFWFKPDGIWVMVIVQPTIRCVDIFRSTDAVTWVAAGSFQPADTGVGLWECPDLFPISVANSDDLKWVLVVSTSHPAGLPYTGMNYWVGDFDGSHFVADHSEPDPVEYGKDFYAGVTFNNLPEQSDPVMIAWASNWAYAAVTPTPSWRGVMSLPRRLWLEVVTDRYRLCQAPVTSFDELLAAPEFAVDGTRFLAADLQIRLSHDSPALVLRLQSSPVEWIEIGVSPATRTAWIDRRNAGHADFHDSYATFDEAALQVAGLEQIDVRIVVDHSIVEVFTCKGRTVLTSLMFPTAPWEIISESNLADLEVRRFRR